MEEGRRDRDEASLNSVPIFYETAMHDYDSAISNYALAQFQNPYTSKCVSMCVCVSKCMCV